MTKTKLRYITSDLEVELPIAIVGSIGYKVHKLGGKINEFPSVCRFNRSPTEGYEDLVGSITTIRMVSGRVLGCVPAQEYGVKENSNFIKSVRDCKILFRAANGKMSRPDHRKFLHDSCEMYDIPGHKNVVSEGFKRHLMSGTLFIKICVDSGIIPHLFHFDLDPSPDQIQSHYWEKRTLKAHKAHDRDVERKYLKKFQAEGKIIVH